MTLTKEQFIALRQKGLSVDKIKAFESGQTPEDLTSQPQIGFGQSLAQSIAKPFLKTGVTLAGGILRGAQILGSERAGEKANELINQGVDTGYLGTVKPFGADSFQKYKSGEIGGAEFATRAGAEALGAGAEIASYGVGGAGAIQAGKAGIKGLVAQGAKTGAKEGLKAGLLMGFGTGLQEASTQPMEEAFKTVVEDTALSGLIGTVTGGIGGATVPLVAKGVQGVKKFANVGDLETKLASGYQRTFNPTARQLKVDRKFGGDSFKFLAQEAPDLPITVNKDGRVMADDAIEMAKQKYIAEATAYKPIIRNSGKYIDIDSAIAKAKKVAREEFDGSDLIKAEQQIDDEVNAFLAQTPQDVNVTSNGKRFVTLNRADDIKTYSWSRGKGWGSPDAEVWNDTNNLIGHALKDAIEKELPNAPIKAMNRRLGQWKNAIDMLEKRNNQVSGSGGKLSKYIIRSVGTTIGAGAGGEDQTTLGRVGGAGAGFWTANAIAAVMSNPNVRLFAVRQLLKRLQKAGRQDLIQEAEQILQSESSKYLLPAKGGSSYVESQAPQINLPTSIRETNLGLDEVKNANIGQNVASQSIEPKVAPATQANINSNIDSSITTKKPNSQAGFISTGKSNPLIEEAKKYKSFEDFSQAVKGGKTQYGDYNPKLRENMPAGYKNITELGVDPEETITVYRGIDDAPGKVKRKINDGDFVTTDFDSALSYTGNPKDVVEMQVKAKTLYNSEPRDFVDEPFYIGSEYIYTTKNAKTLPTDKELTDIWKQAQKPNSEAGKLLKSPLMAGAGATALGVASQIPNEASFTKTPEDIKSESQPVQKVQPKVDYKKEISFRETGSVKKDPYKIVKKNTNNTYDLGKYQINTAALKAYGDDFLGKATTSKELLASPQLQEKFIEGFIKKMEKEGHSKDLIIAMWHRGWGNRSPERLQKLLNEDLTKKYLNNKPK
jgi:hypothetical protein